MNRFLDFSETQTKFLLFLTATALIMGVYLFLKAFTQQDDSAPRLNVYVGEPTAVFTGTFVLDPNTSPADSLELLPGIGRVLADRIVAYREEHRFEKEIDITRVKGIGAQIYERIKPYLKVKPY